VIEALVLLPFIVVVMMCGMVGTMWVLEKVAKVFLWLVWQLNRALGSPDTYDPFK